MLKSTIRVVVVTAAAVAVALPWAGVSADTRAADPSRAVFEDTTLDLADSWGEATACAELGTVVECFRSEAALLEAHPGLASRPPDGAALFAGSSCSSSLRLYRSTGFSGGTLYLTTRQVTHNLSSFGFDNDTSSYRVGACSTLFTWGANVGGSTYPGSTSANARASSMVSGWNNVVSSVYIY